MSNDLPPGQPSQHRAEQALRQKDNEQYQQRAVDQIVPADRRANEMRNVSVNRIVIAAPT
jgi:hypothetical protein